MNSAPNTDHATVIIEAGFEGGSLTLLGIKTANGWRFKIATDEGTMFDLLSDEDRAGMTPSDFRSESEWVDSWKDVLKLLDQHRWHMLSAVHPDFKRQVWAAVKRRSSRKSAQGPFWRRLVSYFGREARKEARWADVIKCQQLSEWRRVCHGKPPYPEKGSITFG